MKTRHVNAQSGRLEDAEWIASPNFEPRPPGLVPELIVVHGISLPPDEFGGRGVEQLFTNQLNPQEDSYYQGIDGLKVSSHLFIRRGGEVIQFVDFNQRAWHAGVSCFDGRENCNDFSIGIELEGADHIAYTASQYDSLASVVLALQQAYPSLHNKAVVGHSDIAPGRKTDPGPLFNWAALRRLTSSDTQPN
ncbi:1,6-anhydro-N-acetylmuramyl-L-alanine amidase AmpD [Thiomicrospira sp.]|uniref:1,6-anhydro-N-acetylmuramyl-L-alanine amidase AmpD n=1 Tax=Thiomicrospira sp. TaxID=935 RepID=UPI0025CBEC3C|nr:1,6-anhydro-N-acetylmuramyl-L-alanine amidase AmpD [Thiomicrospira sp.]